MPEKLPAMDVTRSIGLENPAEVASEIRALMEGRFPGHGFAVIEHLVADLARLYGGDFPGYEACDTSYHNLEHVLDVSLTMARLVDGHELLESAGERLGAEYALAGLCAALFHDAGYIRRRGDRYQSSGGAYTRNHVKRSARVVREYLPEVGLGHLAATCGRVVHFTNCHLPVERAPRRSGQELRLGELLGSADLLAQMADPDYVNKCRERLFSEFVAAGIADDGRPRKCKSFRYRSADDMVAQTPQFMRWAMDERLAKQLGGVARYLDAHFGCENPYLEAIESNYSELQAQLKARRS